MIQFRPSTPRGHDIKAVNEWRPFGGENKTVDIYIGAQLWSGDCKGWGKAKPLCPPPPASVRKSNRYGDLEVKHQKVGEEKKMKLWILRNRPSHPEPRFNRLSGNYIAIAKTYLGYICFKRYTILLQDDSKLAEQKKKRKLSLSKLTDHFTRFALIIPLFTWALKSSTVRHFMNSSFFHQFRNQWLDGIVRNPYANTYFDIRVGSYMQSV